MNPSAKLQTNDTPTPRARTTRRLLVGVAIAAVAGATWAIARGGSRGDAGRSPPAGDTAGMQGMAGMDMSTDGSVLLSPDHIRQYGITFGSVEERTLEADVRTVGIVRFDETKLAQVALKFDGFVDRLHVNFTGQAVRHGQRLLDVYSPALVAGQEELLVAQRVQREMGESAVPGVPAGSSDLTASARRRLSLWDISEEQIDEILRSGQVRRALTVYSPASGVVVEKNVVQGQAVRAGETLYRIGDLSEVWIEAELREADVAQVREGSAATMEFAAYPGRTFDGRIQYVYPTLQEEARTLKVRIAVPNSRGLIKPGMYATVRFVTPVRKALTVPTSALLRTGERTLVFVDMGGGSLMPHEVEIGRIAGEYAEVLAGVEPGQQVVLSAQFLLDSESNLAEVMRSMLGMGMSMDMGDMKGKDMKGKDMKGKSAPPERR
ncbi:MAG: efflux RND transporter periplasmic adaptor subunit [Gemmatimonadales bacterium]